MTRFGVAPRRLRPPVRRPKGPNGPGDVADQSGIYCRMKVLIRLLALSEASDCINSLVRQYTGGGIHRHKRR